MADGINMKLYAIYTDETKELRDIFINSIQDDWDIDVRHWGKVGEGGGDTCTKGWYDILRRKIEFFVEKIREDFDKTIIMSDIDIQFFGRCTDLINKVMLGNDIVFQAEHWPQREINCGFVVLRCNEKTLRFYESVLQYDLESLPLGDQSAMNDLLKENRLNVKWDVLPGQFWAMSHPCPPPPDIVLHHANCTFPVVEGGRTIGSIELKLKQLEMVRIYLMRRRDRARPRFWV